METILLTTVLPALLPALVDWGKMGLSKLFGTNTADPKSFEDWQKQEELGIRKLQALAQIDAPGQNLSKWIVDLRGSLRYLAVAAILGVYLITVLFPGIRVTPENQTGLNQLAGSAFFFLFGDRMYIGMKNKK